MGRFKNVDGERVPFSAAEEAARDLEEAAEAALPVSDPILSPARFAWMLAFTGLDDVWEALEVLLKETDRASFATLKAQRAKSEFHLPATLKMVKSFRAIAEAAAPNADLDEASIRAAWALAAAAAI